MKIKHFTSGLASVFFISACSSTWLEGEPEIPPKKVEQVMVEEPMLAPSFHTHVMLSDYTERLASDLVRNLGNKKLESPIVITAFANYDATLQTTNSLGRILSENLIKDMQVFDIPVIDLHLMYGFMVNDEGEFVFSRNPDDYYHEGDLTYVLSGVLIENERGVIVNARIMNFENQRVLSSASVLIPPYVLAQ